MFTRMKLFAAIMFLLLSAQPAAAGCCDMHDGGTADHANMTHDMDGDDTGHNCCDSDAGDTPEGGDASHCSSCPQVAPALPVLALVPISHTLAVIHIRGPDILPASSPANLFRPPRSVS
jgi:hypothetical protein